MKLGRSEVQQWLDEVAPGTGLVRLAQLAALPRLRITQQVSRGSVLPATIASISRGLGLEPLAELAKFESFEHLASGSPSREELSAFIPTDALLQATVNRLRMAKTLEEELGSESSEDLALNWFALADDGNLRTFLQSELGISQPTLWKMLRTRLREDVSLAVAAYAGFAPSSALIVSGTLTASEAGWASECRENWVNTLPLGQLLEVAEKRLREVGKRERSLETFEDHLG